MYKVRDRRKLEGQTLVTDALDYAHHVLHVAHTVAAIPVACLRHALPTRSRVVYHPHRLPPRCTFLRQRIVRVAAWRVGWCIGGGQTLALPPCRLPCRAAPGGAVMPLRAATTCRARVASAACFTAPAWLVLLTVALTPRRVNAWPHLPSDQPSAIPGSSPRGRTTTPTIVGRRVAWRGDACLTGYSAGNNGRGRACRQSGGYAYYHLWRPLTRTSLPAYPAGRVWTDTFAALDAIRAGSALPFYKHDNSAWQTPGRRGYSSNRAVAHTYTRALAGILTLQSTYSPMPANARSSVWRYTYRWRGG